MSMSEKHATDPARCHRCGERRDESALLPHAGHEYCQPCWRFEVDEHRGGGAVAILLLIGFLALLILTPFVVLL